VRLAGAVPLVVTRLEPHEVQAVLAVAHGVLLTGSESNVHPSNFGEALHDASLPLDPQRDGWTLPLIPQVLARGLPLFAICRGTQEVNVALGGSLHQAVQEVPGLADHRGCEGEPAAVQYASSHPVDVVAGGLLHSIVHCSGFEVNSVHGQGIKRLAPGLRMEAVSADGLIEAFSTG
jgi:putative glutamine amidotransferase